MEQFKKYSPFFTAALLMCVLLVVIYPYYHYYVDPDAVAYLTIARRYARGDIANAINGYWSPWSCWLVALMMRSGFDDLLSMVVVNTIGAIGFLYISQSFFLKFGVVKKLQSVLSITLALFLCYAIFWQSFDDIWECFFLLAALRVMLSDKFSTQPALWTLTGIIGALAYFAKAYAFPFFILNVICCTYFIDKKQWLKISAISILIMIFCSSGWIYLLHQKYGIWTTSTAGTLNMSWYLLGHPQWKEGIRHLIPPHSASSPYYWEDPWYANGDTPQFWSSIQLLGRQFLKGGYNFLKFILSILQLSVFFPLIIWLAVKLLRSEKTKALFPGKTAVLALSFLLFPLAYMLINFEPRYIWYMLPLAMVMGAVYIQNRWAGKKQVFDFVTILFAASFLVVPAIGMKKLHNEGKVEYELAQQFKAGGLTGSFTSNAKAGVETQKMVRLGYFANSLSYYYPLPNTSLSEVQKEIQRYHIKYYFYICKRPLDDFALADRYGFPYKLVYASGAMKIFEMTQQ